jgi:hypothetical protein
MSLNESITLELRKMAAALVGLVLPHAQHGIRPSMPETLDELSMVMELAI